MQGQGCNKKFSAWQAPYMAFFNKEFYVDVVQNWTGTGSAYMLAACFFAAIFMILPLAVPIIGACNDPQLTTFIQQIPKVTFADGQVSIDKPTPYQIKDPKTGTVIAVFKTTDKGVPKIGPDDPPIVVTKDAMAIAAERDAEAKTYEFAQLTRMVPNGFAFNGSDALWCVRTILLGVPIGAFVLVIPILFGAHFMQMLIYGGVAMLLINTTEHPLPYSSAMRLAAIAMTPSILISSALNFISVWVHGVHSVQMGWVFASMVLTVALLWFASNACREAQDRARLSA